MSSIRSFVFSGVVLGSLCGCGVHSPGADGTLPLPADWKNAAGFPVASPQRDLSRWWGRFNDPALNRVIAAAIQDNPDVKTATARIREARANRDAQNAALFPILDSSASANSRRNRNDVTGTTRSSAYSAGLDASWELDLFGRNRSAVQAAAASLGAAGENLNSVYAALAGEIAAAYTNLRANEARLAVLKKNLTTREETAELAGWRLKAGEADSLEATQSQSSLESARAAMPSLEGAISQGKNDLALLSGRAPGALDAMLGNSRGIPIPPSSLAIGIPADVLRQRPDVRLAGYQVLAAAASTRATEATKYPSLRLSGALGLDTASSRRLFDPENLAANLAGNITSPIFDAGRNQANLEVAKVTKDIAIAQYEKSIQTAFREVSDSLAGRATLGEQLRAQAAVSNAAQASFNLADLRYKNGVSSYFDLLDAQRTLFTAQQATVQVQAQQMQNLVTLYKVLGGGWTAPAPMPASARSN